MNLTANATAWLAKGERGMSSEAMLFVLSGADPKEFRSHPLDPGDLRRCRLMLEQVPELQDRLPKMADVSPEWFALVRHWDELSALMDEESPEWRRGRGVAARAFHRMNSLLSAAREGRTAMNTTSARDDD